jgi:hypothetical protein
MSFFKDIINKADKLEDDILGPDFPYYKFVKNPSQLGMSSNGSLDALSKDIGGIVNYVQLLVSGTGQANGSRSGKPLGNQFFIKTGGKCRNYKDKKIVPRSMYVNNVPNGDIDFLKDLTGYGGGGDFAGLVPGIMNNMNSINPIKLFGAFTQGNEPLCAEVTLDTIDENSNIRKKTAFVPINELIDLVNNKDIKGNNYRYSKINMRNFKNALNKEGFENLCKTCKTYNSEEQQQIIFENINQIQNAEVKRENNLLKNLYFTSFSLFILYIFYKYISKK